MTQNLLKFGRSHDDWETLIAAGQDFLIERARLRKDTSYTELNSVLARRTGLRLFDFEREDERAALGHLLGEIVARTFPTTGFMLSSIVNYLNENDAGRGFYALGEQLGLLARGASPQAKERFWIEQVNATFNHYSRDGVTDTR